MGFMPAHLARKPKVGKTVTYFRPTTGHRVPGQVIAVKNFNVVDLRLADGTIVRDVARSLGRQALGTWGWVRGRENSSLVALGGAKVGSTLARAEAIWLASAYNPATPQWLKDLSGNGHHMRLGSVGRASVLDGAFVLPGSNGNYTSTPDHADFAWTDLDVRVDLALDDYTSPQYAKLVTQDGTNIRAFVFYVDQNTGKLLLYWSPDGTANVNGLSTVALPDVGGARLWVRTTLDVDNGAGGYTLRFYTSSDGSAWSQLGADVVGGAPTSIFNSTAVLTIGDGVSGSQNPAGRIYRAIVKNGIDGTTVFDADFSTQPDGVPWFLESTGKRVTVFPKRSVVSQGALYLPGLTGQAAQAAITPELNITGNIDIRVKVAPDDWTTGNYQVLISKAATTGSVDYLFAISATANRIILVINNLVYETNNLFSGFVDGQSYWIRATRVASTGVIQFFTSSDGITWTQLGTNVASTVGAINTNGTELAIGRRLDNTAIQLLAGKVHRAIIKNGIDGPTVFDADFSSWNDGDGVAVPKQIVTGQYVKVLTDTTGADSNDPKFLRYMAGSGDCCDKGLYLPGVSSNNASVPDGNELDIVGDITLDCEVAMDDWTPATAQILVNKFQNAGQKSYQLYLDTVGQLTFQWSADGTATTGSVVTGVAVPAVDGERLWVRGALKANDGSGNRIIKFFTSRDGATWTQLGTTITTAGVASIFSGTDPLVIGAQGAAFPSSGRFFRARIYNGYFDGTTQGGSLVLDVAFGDAAEPYATFAARTGQTVTINRSASGRKAVLVDRSMFLFGTDDYMEAPNHAALDFAAAESFSIAAALRAFGSGAGYMSYVSKRISTGAGYELGADGVNTFYTIHDGAIGTDNIGGVSRNGTALVVSGVRSVANDNTKLTIDNTVVTTTDTTTATLAHTVGVKIGARFAASANFAAMEFIGASIHRSALSAADIAKLDYDYATNA